MILTIHDLSVTQRPKIYPIALTSWPPSHVLMLTFPVHGVVSVQDMMPLQYIFTMALEQDAKNGSNGKHTADLLHLRCSQVLSTVPLYSELQPARLGQVNPGHPRLIKNQ